MALYRSLIKVLYRASCCSASEVLVLKHFISCCTFNPSQHHMYSEAQMAVRRLQLVGKVAPITVEQLSDQRRRDAESYLALAIPLNRVSMLTLVLLAIQRDFGTWSCCCTLCTDCIFSLSTQIILLNDQASLQAAADLLGISMTETMEVLTKSYKAAMTLPDLVKTMRSSSSGSTTPATLLPPSFRQVVGLDGEWRASMFENLDHFGCSILQVRFTVLLNLKL